MNQCPEVQVTDQKQFDMRKASSCVAMCQNLLQAYYNALMGDQTIQVRFQERWVEYNKANVIALREAYMNLYAQCPGAASAGLPNLNPGLSVRRGPPARGFQVFPRL